MAAAAIDDCPDTEVFLALQEGSLDGAEHEALERHIDGCAECRALVATLMRDPARAAEISRTSLAAEDARGEAERLARGVELGRYLIVDWLGAGGMGTVYVAYDPQLDRKIALKILRRSTSGRGGNDPQALLREAQAMARLQDPNVVTIHDVGAVGERVYIAMEYVAGATLRRWLAEKSRSVAEILTMFRFAGKGLSAAHRAGLVHRDFKPDNVLVATDGRVRVTDFGLARGLAPQSADATPSGGPISAPDEPEASRTTIAGTPAYMAPEQLRGEKADARSDQFCFCVALYEALWGARPFTGRTLAELTESVASGQLVEPPAARQAPTWLRRAVLRGLSSRPDERWPSMDALLAALHAGARRSRWGWLAGGLAVVAIAGLAGVLRAPGAVAEDPCHGGRAALAGVWDDGHRRAGAAAFHATGKAYADEAWQTVAANLDAYAASWATMRDESCAATRRGDQSAQLLDLRTACLDERRAELRALAGLLDQADAALVARMAGGATPLALLDHCADARALLAVVPVPSPEVGARVAAAREGLARVHALVFAGRGPEALAAAQASVDEASTIHYRPLDGQAALLLGQAHVTAAHPAAAEKALFEAIVAAEAGRDDATKVIAELSLAQALRDLGGRFAEADAWTQLTISTIQRLGGNAALEVQAETTLAAACSRKGETEEGLAHIERARQLLTQLPKDDPTYRGNLENTTALLLQRKGDLPAALAAAERARAAYASMHGEEGFSAGGVEMTFGAILADSGRPEEALPHLEHARAILLAANGPEHLMTLQATDDLAAVLATLGEGEKSLALHQEVLAIERRTLGPDHLEVGGTEAMIGDSLSALRRYPEALAAYLEAQRIAKKTGNDLGFEKGTLDTSIAATLVRLGRPREALDLVRRVLATVPPESDARGEALVVEADATLALGDAAGALPVAEQAVDAIGDDPLEVAEARFCLARALWAAHGDRVRARGLAEQARATWGATKGQRLAIADVDAWLAAHH